MKKTTAYCDMCQHETNGVVLALRHADVDLCDACADKPTAKLLLKLEEACRREVKYRGLAGLMTAQENAQCDAQLKKVGS